MLDQFQFFVNFQQIENNEITRLYADILFHNEKI